MVRRLLIMLPVISALPACVVALFRVIVLHERHLRRLLTGSFQYYHHWRTHRALEMDGPIPLPVQQPELGLIWKVPNMGGLQHH
jgi:hypothetical protein